MTRAQALFQDKRIAQATELIEEALQEHQKGIQSIEPPKVKLQTSYKELLTRMNNTRGGPLWYPYLASGIGHGPYVELGDGSVKLDVVGGIGVHIFGHSHPRIVKASLRGAIKNTVMQGHLQQNIEAVQLGEEFQRRSGLDTCFISTSGAMACENALKIAYHNRPNASRLLAFDSCFMGRTLSLSQITDKPDGRAKLPLNLQVDYLPFFDPHDPIQSSQRCIESLKKHLARYPKQHAAIVLELVQGEGGIRVGNRDFFHQILQIAKDEGLITIIDEVQTFARTSQLFAFQHFALEEFVDIVTVGKAAQLCATLYRKELQPQAGLLSQTYTASTVCIEACLELFKLFDEEQLFGAQGKNMHLHQLFVDGMQALRTQFPDRVHGPYGIGLMGTFTPFDGKVEQTKHFSQKLFDRGVISFLAGKSPCRARFLFPGLVMQDKDMELLLEVIERTLCDQS